MELTDTQKEEVAAWFAGGASLDEIQKRIKAEFGIHMTYLDVRLMVAELPQPVEAGGGGGTAGGWEAREDGGGTAGATGTSETSGRKPQDRGRKFTDGPDSRQGGTSEDGEGAGYSTEAQTVSAPTVTIDALMIPGTIASGEVTFSDGQTGKWFLDQMGRLGLGGDLPQGYRPSPTDAALFQQQLMGLLQAKGLC